MRSWIWPWHTFLAHVFSSKGLYLALARLKFACSSVPLPAAAVPEQSPPSCPFMFPTGKSEWRLSGPSAHSWAVPWPFLPWLPHQFIPMPRKGCRNAHYFFCDDNNKTYLYLQNDEEQVRIHKYYCWWNPFRAYVLHNQFNSSNSTLIKIKLAITLPSQINYNSLILSGVQFMFNYPKRSPKESFTTGLFPLALKASREYVVSTLLPPL